MAFAYFRRHQKKLIAILAILAMFSFVLADSLPRMLNASAAAGDREVAKLYGETVYQSQLNELAQERGLANQFVSRLVPYGGSQPFGGLKTRDMVDAMILKHEADRLGIPSGADMGRAFLKSITGGKLTGRMFEAMLSGFNNQVGGEQVLAAIGNQVRIGRVRVLPGSAMVTPYDVYRAYRDENEKVSAKLVEVPVSRFLDKVPEPSDAEVRAYYDKYKDAPPDPTRPTPGFKVPRQVQVEVLSIDGNALARGIKDKLTEDELRSAYENRKANYEVQPGPGDLPVDLFAGQPELTPPAIRPFAEVRSILAAELAEEKAQARIEDTFDRIKQDVLDKFFDEYQDTLDAREEARKGGESSLPPLPEPGSLKDLAAREKLNYELSPMLSREEAERHGQISGAQVGLSRVGDGRKFVDEFFDPRTALYESVTLSDLVGTRYLARKIKDAEPRVPPLDEVRSQVALAWKMEKARPLAEKAAQEVAARLEKQKAPPKESTFEGYPVATVPAISRKYTPFNLTMNAMQLPEPEETPISEVPSPGDAFRAAYFGLEPGKVAVAPNQPATSYYVMMFERRDPATFAALYAPAGDEYRYKSFARDQANRKLVEDWMGWLRKQAGLPEDWVPEDEAREKEQADHRG